MLAAGFAAVALVPLAALAPAAWRAAAPRRAADRRRRREPAAARRPSVLGAVLAGTGPATRAIGVRMAFDAGPGPDRRAGAHARWPEPPTAVGALVAALVFGASLIGLVTTPGRYGQNWDQMLDAGYADVPGQAAAQLLSGIPGLTGVGGGRERRAERQRHVQVPAIARGPGSAGNRLPDGA